MPVTLFLATQSVYTFHMRLAVAFLCLITLASAAPQSAPPNQPAHQLYDSLNTLRPDPATSYQILPDHRVELRRGDAKLSFDQGQLFFFSPLEGQITGVVFAGRGHILVLPRETIEKQQLARFLGAPILDQDFASAYLRFTDATAADLLHQLQSAGLKPQTDAGAATRWEPVIAHLNPSQSLRMVCGSLVASKQGYFYANLDGIATGPFDFVLDPLRPEPFLLGQGKKVNEANFYDVWASYKLPDSTTLTPEFRAVNYTLDTVIQPDHSLDATATINLRAAGIGDRLLVFTLARALNVDIITSSGGQPLEFFQNQGLTTQERTTRGNDYLLVALPKPVPRDQEFSLRFHYRGNIIDDAGNDVLFVGARESWYPHLGDAAEFANYDLTMRWPKKLRLIATGTKLDEREDGEFRVAHWKTDKPAALAGFNLGEYASASFTAANYSIDVYANRQLEQELSRRLAASPDALDSAIGATRSGFPEMTREISSLPPNPAAALKQLGKDIDASIRFYESYNGAFPFRTLSVSQIPGTFGQGWPSLLYVSTYSFLPSEAQRRAGLSTNAQEHFSEIVPFHEVAHQWWGNVVGWSSYRDQWIDEAMANYMALLFADTRKNPDHALRVWLQRYRQKLIEKSPNADEPADKVGALALGIRLNSSKSPNAYEDVIYPKGAWVIHMLHEMLRQPGPNPNARFNALLHTLITTYEYRALNTQDLRREVEAVMTPSMDLEGGHSMEWFFEEWIKGTGIPHYRVEFTTHKTDKGLAIKGKIFQTNVPQSFIARVPIYSAGPGNHSIPLGSVVAAGLETSFHFTASTAPHKLVIDPQMTLLCTTE